MIMSPTYRSADVARVPEIDIRRELSRTEVDSNVGTTSPVHGVDVHSMLHQGEKEPRDVPAETGTGAGNSQHIDRVLLTH